MPKKSSIPQALQAWIDARKRHHLSHAHVQMARELGMNPKKLGKLDNHRQEPWKAPLPQFIEQLYERRFHRRRPQSVRTLEGMPAGEMGKQAERHAAKAARLDAEGYGAAETALGFVDRINDRDAAGLKAMMTDDHRFVDATGAVHGREAMETGWTAYFAGFPDYRIEVERTVAANDTVALFGWASGTFSGSRSALGPAAWRIPAGWLATIRHGRVAEWRVCCDVEPMLRSMGIDRFQPRSRAPAAASFECYVVLLSHARPNPYSIELIRAHVGHLERLQAGGHLELCGPFPDHAGGILVLRAASREQARELAEADPFVASGAAVYELRLLRVANPENGFLMGGGAPAPL